jgi:hypothetical protein
MIYCKELNLSFETKEAMFTELQKHKVSLKALKKSTVKYSDGFDCLLTENDTVNNVVKANNPVNEDITQLLVKVAMNTTNIMDSHCDVHIPGLWKRTLDHSNKKLHLQEHKREFDKVISNDALAYTRQLAWKTLGAEYEGTTQALIFESLVKSSRNPLMFEQYKNGWVTNHSVGMEYVDIVLCVNSEERWWAEEKENFDKYYPQVVNKEDVDNQGYFWAVLEAKLKEGSAVLMGSNYVTPTLDNNLKTEKSLSDTDSAEATQKEETTNFLSLIKI